MRNLNEQLSINNKFWAILLKLEKLLEITHMITKKK